MPLTAWPPVLRPIRRVQGFPDAVDGFQSTVDLHPLGWFAHAAPFAVEIHSDGGR